MLPHRGHAPLSYRRVGRTDLEQILAVHLEPGQAERFLGPLPDIVAAVRGGPYHGLWAIEADGAMVGFYVLHPDPRDASCWWLGWFALDRRAQGRGYGRAAMQAILRRIGRIPGLRRARLLVAPDNAPARHLYGRLGFRAAGALRATGELILEIATGAMAALAPAIGACEAASPSGLKRRSGHRRLRLRAGPHAAWVIGVERGPPEGFVA